MVITKINQEKMLDFIKDAISKVEKEEYEIKKLNVPNTSYKLYGKPIYDGNLFIIGNKKYIKRLSNRYRMKPSMFIKRNFKFKLNKFKKYMDKNHKGIIIEFNDNPENEPYKFKKIIGLKESNYLYLDGAMDIYKSHSKDNESNNIPMEHFNNYINSLEYVFIYKAKSKKKILNSLNGK